MTERAVSEERADVLAYLARKRENAETMAAKSAEFTDQGRWTARQIAILMQDIEAGLHVGEVETAALRQAELERDGPPVPAQGAWPYRDHRDCSQTGDG